ncbi:hypothetical protein [Streptomyces sp. NPDC006355]|uniref:hypothetical protein n=1 Tax=Streptomyces sp. NPDC006355 TaxID=3156758 RepID=UPI0033BB7D40
MTPLVIGVGVLALSAALAFALWLWWASGHGRHRKPRQAAPVLLVAHEVPDGGPGETECVVLSAPPAPSALPSREGQEEAGGADPDTVALLLAADSADFAHCPAEGRRTPHFLHRDGTRTCCRCETTTAGDQT